jgi:N6-adenosine-specific RNA methylase IME4
MKKYNIIYADPAWSYDKKIGQGVADDIYTTMDTEAIKNLPVQSISADDCFLFLWVTFPMLVEGLEVIKAWGFEYKTLGFSWIKTNKRQNQSQLSFLPVDSIDTFFGIGHYTKSNCEVCLIGKKGSPKVIDNSVSSVLISPLRGHSRKPDEARERIVQLCGDLPRIELFARQNHGGWDAWGNEVGESVKLETSDSNGI